MLMWLTQSPALTHLHTGIARSTCMRVGGEEGWKSACRVLRRRLERLPKVQPAPDEVHMGKDIRELFNSALKIQKDKKDGYLSVDVLLLAVLGSQEVTSCLQEAGLGRSQLESAINELRTKGKGSGEAKTVDSRSGDENFEALLKYGVDLTANAARLDPVIGRDEEIRRVVQVLCRRCVQGWEGGGWALLQWGKQRCAYSSGGRHVMCVCVQVYC